MQNRTVPPVADVARAPRAERLSMTDELRRQSSLAYTEADRDLEACKREIGKVEEALRDPAITPEKRKGLQYKLARLQARKSSLARGLEKATGNLDGGRHKASELAPWVERRL